MPTFAAEITIAVNNRITLLLWILLSVTQLIGQQPTQASPTTVQIPYKPEPIDTTPVRYYFSGQPEVLIDFRDTFPDTHFRQYDPAREQMPFFWGNLGNAGTAARPLWFDLSAARGFSSGIQPFDIYRLKPENLRFFQNTRTFTDVWYNQGKNQKESAAKAVYSRQFARGTVLALEYRNLRYLGQYRYQFTKHNALSVGLKIPIGNHYKSFFVFTKNTNKVQENGGITSDSTLNDANFGGAISLPIQLSDEHAVTRHSGWDVQWSNHLDFFGKSRPAPPDTAKIGKSDFLVQKIEPFRRAFRLTHVLTYGNQNYKFSEKFTSSSSADKAFLSDFVLDDRGIRHYWRYRKLDNQVMVSTFKNKTAGTQADFFSAGLQHTYYKIVEESGETVLQNLFLLGKIRLNPRNLLQWSSDAALGFGKNTGEYSLSAQLNLNLKQAGALEFTLLNQRRPPGRVYENVQISFANLWQNAFDKVLETKLSAAYHLPNQGISLTANSHLVHNYLYFDGNVRPQQATQALQVQQLMVQFDKKIRWLHLITSSGIQSINRPELFEAPTWISQNSLFFDGRVFKRRMQLQMGADLLLNRAFDPMGYNPVIWQFYQQNGFSAKTYPWVDVFAAFKVSNFRGFVRYENVTDFFENTLYYSTAHYPQPLKAIRFGISWQFLDSNKSTGPTDSSDGKNNTQQQNVPGRGGF